eukprot:CAMPEP_0197026922 /NCGR_PEP_ID=MMETSP1384-20130603/6926_1 /TAXON_ID=29189 /ORGANISM="Ammonia sp." /LENGTH=115 /DNA_ID=CAMNT_0042455687 /DNA_START=40 /DNA_END=384 /DNA_ORIENTATION=+
MTIARNDEQKNHMNKNGNNSSNDDESNPGDSNNNNTNDRLLALAKTDSDLSFLTSIEEKIKKYRASYTARMDKAYKANSKLREEDEKWRHHIEQQHQQNLQSVAKQQAKQGNTEN